ncbi:MAG: rhodanese-like domain-containing protein [Alphaproteobacteria bacterium]|nr:rhodanese-like domain-containing protein [Alphaproteobacteria bacterium]
MTEESIQTIEPKNLTDDDLILDVRTNQEHNEQSLNRPHWHIPMDELNIKDFIKNYHLSEKTPLHILCRSGHRATRVAEKFKKEGFFNVKTIEGGILKAKEQGIRLIEHPSWSLRRKLEFTSGVLIFIGTLLSLFISKTFYLVPLTIGFLLMVKSIVGKCFLENLINLFFKDRL